MLRGGDVNGELRRLLARDPQWACALVRARRPELPDAALAKALADALADRATQAGALLVITRTGVLFEQLDRALESGEPGALAAIEELDADGAARLAASLPSLSPVARATLARTLGGAPAGTLLISALVRDADPEV